MVSIQNLKGRQKQEVASISNLYANIQGGLINDWWEDHNRNQLKETNNCQTFSDFDNCTSGL